MIDALLPFYGDPALMRLAVRSVLDQDTTGWRLVIVDDCYPDNVTSTLAGVAPGPRRGLHPQREDSRGQRGLHRRSAGDSAHVVFMGCDDLLEPGYISAVRRTLAQHPDAAIVCPGVQVIDDAGEAVEPLVDPSETPPAHSGGATTLAGEDALVSLMSGNWTYFPSLCWRRDVISEINFRPEYGVVLDLGAASSTYSSRARALVVIPDRLFRYRRHAGSESATKTVVGARFEEERRYFGTIATELDRSGLHRAARAARRHVTSRLHAAALLPTAARNRDGAAVTRLLRHATR